MKMNRRDYLKQMSAAGVIAGAAGLQAFAQQCTQGPKPCPPDPPCINPGPGAPLTWEPRWCEDFPPCERSDYVKLIFEGLMGFARREEGGKTVCDVGFHRKGDSPLHHHLEITAYNNAINEDRCGPPVYKTPANVKQIKTLTLEVPQPKVVDQAYFYQRGQACSRQQLSYYEDFRWIIDFESPYLHGKHLEKNKSVYGPRLTVPSGIFYTLRKTASTFRAQTQDGSHVCQLGNVADIMGVNVYIESRSVVTLKVDGVPYEISAPGEIYFRNHCVQDNTPDGHCVAEPYNLKDKKKRSDFFLNYKAFDRGSAPEYQLFLAESHEQTHQPDVICEKSAYRKPKKYNDEAPCSAAGYGSGKIGLPQYP
jgi:hypothetical protein